MSAVTTSKACFTNLEISPNIISLDLGDDKCKKYDFAAAFNLFDEDGQGTISEEELKHMLLKLQIITQANERCVCMCVCVRVCMYACMWVEMCMCMCYTSVGVFAYVKQNLWSISAHHLLLFILILCCSLSLVLCFKHFQLLHFIVYTIFCLIFCTFYSSQSNPTSSGNVR